MQNICYLIVEKVCIFLIFLITAVQYHYNVKRTRMRREIQDIWICINLKHVCKFRVHSHERRNELKPVWDFISV